MKVLIYGSSKWDGAEAVAREIGSLPHDAVIVCGKCCGAGPLAWQAAERLGFEVRECPADWTTRARTRHMHNQVALETVRPDLVILFGKDIESYWSEHDMATRAMRLGIPVWWCSGKRTVVLSVRESRKKRVELDLRKAKGVQRDGGS